MRPSVFFDLDGTLTDPAVGITRSIRFALDALGVAPPPDDDLFWCIGPPLRGGLARLVGERDSDRALALYRERFAETGLYENRLYEGVPEMLDVLRDGGATLYVASSKPQVFVARILEHFGIADRFDACFGAELDGRLGDKTELLGHALAVTGTLAASATMVGDRRHDIIGARNNALRAVGVRYGFGSATELNEAGAHHTVGSPAELPPLLLPTGG